MADDGDIAVMRQVLVVSKSGVIGMPMRDDRAIYRLPRIDVDLSLRAVDSFGVEY